VELCRVGGEGVAVLDCDFKGEGGGFEVNWEEGFEKVVTDVEFGTS